MRPVEKLDQLGVLNHTRIEYKFHRFSMVRHPRADCLIAWMRIRRISAREADCRVQDAFIFGWWIMF